MHGGWWYIILGVIIAAGGGILATYGWHILPKPPQAEVPPITTTTTSQTTIIPPTSETSPSTITPEQRTAIPLIDIELERVKASPDFAQFEIQFAYDIFLHNKSDVPISNIRVARAVIPDKNKQKILTREAQGKLRPFEKRINVLGPDERRQIHREHTSSYEFMAIVIYYKDQLDRPYRCTFEGDRDGLYLKDKEALGRKEGK